MSEKNEKTTVAVEAEVPETEPTQATATETPKRPSRKFVSLDGDDDQALLRVTPRFKRNTRRVLATAAATAIYPPLGAVTALGAAWQAIND
jgi:hypothetical protein